jgi:hypothetical protein
VDQAIFNYNRTHRRQLSAISYQLSAHLMYLANHAGHPERSEESRFKAGISDRREDSSLRSE